ncbi:NADH dehydrogenase subunit K [Nitrosospira multiformis]|uniref:NADH-quinone oxidoreductase subunit K n=1 Tax=Nitrosospira multiformis TaxID=1231 RepID=A0A1I0DU88_9PROT|nr:NADH-quinone oxidoreductase subunit NuoK [Nitrosospira multiformis]SET36201.1 NADH dehydrogenase subunit K [Nitrosospira multiformis]
MTTAEAVSAAAAKAAAIPMHHGLLFAAILFALGMIGILVRRNLIFILMSIEIMLNAAGLAFVVAGSHWAQADGQVMFIFILSVAAAEVSVGLALLLLLHRRFQTLDADAVSQMRG